MTSSQSSAPTILKYKTDFEKSVVIGNFENRGWIRTNDGRSFKIFSFVIISSRDNSDDICDALK